MTDIPPKKLSSDPDHEYYDPVYMRVKVWLDGVQQPFTETYNQTEGWIERYKDVEGQLVIEDDEFVIERVHGVVDVEFIK